jgi:hypothetical protein
VPGCQDGGIDDPNTARFRLEVIKVPLRAPVQAAIVSSPRIFQGCRCRRATKSAPRRISAIASGGARPRRAASAAAAVRGAAADAARQSGPPTGPNQCHDITVYPEIGLAAARARARLLLDIRDPERPVRIDAAADANMSFWHSATFNNDGTKICSAMSGAAAVSRAAARPTSTSGAPTRCSRSRTTS